MSLSKRIKRLEGVSSWEPYCGEYYYECKKEPYCSVYDEVANYGNYDNGLQFSYTNLPFSHTSTTSSSSSSSTSSSSSRSTPSSTWVRFRKSDITDEVGNMIKIHNSWLKKENVFFYDDIYAPIRSKIEKANKNKEKK